MKSNGITLVEKHNELLERIRKASSVESVRNLFLDVKEFVSLYEEIDITSVKRVFGKYADKIADMLEENEAVYNRLTEKVEAVERREYDFSGEKEDVQAVQGRVLMLMAELPKTKTTANAGIVANVIDKAIKAGTVGCKAVQELMKYPAYSDMVSENQKNSAYLGGKSEEQRVFEKVKEKELRNIEKVRADVFLEGFHLRNINKRVLELKKSSRWA